VIRSEERAGPWIGLQIWGENTPLCSQNVAAPGDRIPFIRLRPQEGHHLL